MENIVLSQAIKKRIEKYSSGQIKTFLGLPLKQEVEDEDFCIMGVPYDTSTTNRPGTRFGPRAIREVMNFFGEYSQESDWEINNLKGMDYGNIPVVLGYTMETMQLIYEYVKKVLDAGTVPIVLGGDHLITYAELRAYAEKYGPVSMVHFDSHNDTTDKGIGGVEFYHGSPFIRAIEDGYLDASHSIQVGIRGYIDKCRLEYAKEHDMEVVTARMIHEIGLEETAKRIKDKVGKSKCIVTFDIDFLDPIAAPGTGTPVTGGFSTHEAMELIIQGLTGLDIVGFDIVEVMEDYDPGRITAYAATSIVHEFIATLSRNKSMKEDIKNG